jgi:hypothetical protein
VRLRLNALRLWEGTNRVVSAMEESVFQGRFAWGLAGTFFDSENPYVAAAILPRRRLP